MSGVTEVFAAFLKLGLTSFGGPIAHLGFFRTEFVTRRRWLTDAAYADLLALCQFLPGPASSQVGFAVGYLRAGLAGAFAAWIGFTLPSALLMLALAAGFAKFHPGTGLLEGLKVAALAVVAHAIGKMAWQLCPDLPRSAFAAAGGISALAISTSWIHPVLIGTSLLAGAALLHPIPTPREESAASPPTTLANVCLGLFVVLLGFLPWIAGATENRWIQAADAFYRTGALVFGGGHVVLPLLETETLSRGWLSRDDFFAGYGAAQALPGPLFSVAAYLGALVLPNGPGWLAGTWCLVAIFTPSFLLVLGILPRWHRLRTRPRLRGALAGANAVVVGLLGAVFLHPMCGETLTSPRNLALAVAALGALCFTRIPPWLLVVICAAAGSLLSPG